MHNHINKTITRIIKNNKTTIIISVSTSILTFLIMTSAVMALLISQDGSIGSALSNLTNQSKTVMTDSVKEQSNVINAVEKANPAVVSIVITKDVPTYEQYYQNFGGFSIPQQKQNGTEKQQIGGGSGFFVTANGYIITNNHVVEDTTAEYTVITSDNTKYTAKVLAKDSTMDVAVIKIEGKGFKFLTFANSDNLKLGQTAIAIGNALAQYQNSISMGIISGLSRLITAGNTTGASEQLSNVIQTDAAINPGNSGGPLLDINGNVIGVNVAVENGANSIGFALPSNMVKSIADSVIKNGEIVRPYLGVRYVQINNAYKKSNNLTVDYGALVLRGATPTELAVIPGSPADKAGIVENDIILEVDGTKINENKSLISIIRQKQIDQTVTLKILSKGTEKEVKVKLEKAPKNL